jgi:hypothetical protein
MIRMFNRPSRSLSAVLRVGLLAAVSAALLMLGGHSSAPAASAQVPNSITIVKDAVPDDAQDFPFTSGPVVNQCTPSGFLLDDDMDATLQNSMTFPFSPGCNLFNTFTEVVPFGWALTNIVCTVTGPQGSLPQTVITIGGNSTFDPGDTSVSIDLASNEKATCTFTNVKMPSGDISICKQTDPSGGTGFTFGWSSPTIHPLPFMLDDDQCFTTTLDPAQGPYSFSELLPLPAGWQLMFITCAGGANVLIGSNATYDPGDMGVTIDLKPGEHVTCTFIDVLGTTIGWGDLNCDGRVTSVDALLGLQHVAGLTGPPRASCPAMGDDVRILFGEGG